MKTKGFLNINDNEVPFTLNEEGITIVEPFDIDSIFAVFDRKQFELISGVTDDNRDIVFFGCSYYKHFLSAKGWAITSKNLTEDALDEFDSISFRGKSIDTFYSPKHSFYLEKQDEHNKQVASLIIKPWAEFIKSFDVEVDGENFKCLFDVYVNYNLKRNDHNLGDVFSQMSLLFNERKNIAEIPKYYLYVYDFMKFISFRRNIKFDLIELKKKNENGLYEKIATVDFFTESYTQTYSLDDMHCITLSEIEKDFCNLFPCAVTRRNIGYMDDLFIPITDLDYRTVDPNKYLSCALSFEGEYLKAFPKDKESTNKIFAEIKQCTIQLISNMEYEMGSAKSNRKAKSYVDRILREISNIDGTLEEKFNNACKRFSNVLSEFIEKVMLDEEVEGKINLGEIFADMRNSIGHGNPKKIKREHIVVYRIARCLIYVIILNSSKVDSSTIKKLIFKIF